MRNRVLAAACFGLILEACSSRPREFTPEVGYAPSDQMKFDAAYADCKQLYVTGKLNRSGRLGTGGVGAAAGGAMGAAGTAAATSAGLWGGVAVMSATLVLMPFAAVGGAMGMAKIKRHKKEKAIMQVMEGCLREHGYAVTIWTKATRMKPVKALQGS